MTERPTPDEESLHTVELHGILARVQAGDEAAWEELIRRAAGQLERLARGMLRRFPRVARWEDTDDVLNSALLRLLRALRQVRPESMRRFYGLAAEQIRRELLDLARRHRASVGDSALHGTDGGPAHEPAAPAEQGDLERWCVFHEAVAELPVEQREVVGLVFYHGWTQEQVAELFGVSVRTVARWWQDALRTLRGKSEA